MRRIIILIAVISVLGFVTLEQKRWNLRPYREISYSHLNTIYLDEIHKTIGLMDEYDELKTELLNNETLSEAKDKRFITLQKELKKKKENKEAEDWLRYNPSFWCSYCGGRLKGEYVGKIQKVTFLRNPPEGAKDLKIILAELWYAYPVSRVKCTRCGRIVEF